MSETAKVAARTLTAVTREMEERQDVLDRLDAVAADGDHGATMVLGWRAVAAEVAEPGDRTPSQLLRDAGAAFADVGGSIGPLWGTALLRAGRALDDLGGDALRDPQGLARVVSAGVDGMAQRGGAREGDKTLMDVMLPAARALDQAAAEGATVEDALGAALRAAAAGLEHTATLSARRGRARRLADRTLGHQDAGAASAFLIWRRAVVVVFPHVEVADVVAG